MKNLFKILFASSFILFSQNAISQTVTIAQLMDKINCENYDCFDQFIKQNGFCFDEKFTKNPKGIFNRYSTCDYYYFQEEKDRTIKTKNHCSFGILYTKCRSVSIGTSSIDYFKSLIQQLEPFGFDISQIDTNAKKQRLKIRNPKKAGIIVEIFIYEMTKEGIGTWPMYQIVIEEEPYFKKE